MKELRRRRRRAHRPLRRLRPRSSRRSRSSARCPASYVVKTDGLAAGKGVLVTDVARRGRATTCAPSSPGATFGDAGRTVVIEEGLTGPEVSVLAVCDGTPGRGPGRRPRTSSGSATATPGPTPAAWARARPCPVADDDLVDEVLDRFVEPTLAELRRRGIDYRGVLYAGLMLTPDGPEADRVQRPLRRPRGPGRAAPPDLATWPSCWPRPPPATSPRRRPTFADDAAVTRRAAPPRATRRRPAPATSSTGLDGGRGVAGVEVFCAGVGRRRRRRAGHRRRPGARRRRHAARRSPTARDRAYDAAADASPGPACTTAPTSPSERLQASER